MHFNLERVAIYLIYYLIYHSQFFRIHDGEFVQKVIDLVKEDKSKFQTSDRIIGKLSVVLEELPDVPLYYVTDDLVKKFHCVPPNLIQIR